MAPACVCAPSGHKGSFRCRHHRAAARVVVSDRESQEAVSQASATCLCAPTSHPGSFRCRLHRNQEADWKGRPLLRSAPAKPLRNSELPPAKSGDGYGLKKAAFARTNRSLSESKLRCELNKAMPEIVAAVEDLRVSPAGPMEILTKNGKLIVEQIPGAAMARATNSINQDSALPTDAVTVKGSTETMNILRSQTKAAKRPPTSNRRLRAKSDILLANML